jgi:hypothetical protein
MVGQYYLEKRYSRGTGFERTKASAEPTEDVVA